VTPAYRSLTPAQTVGSAGITALGDGMTRAILPLIAVSISSAPWAIGLLQAVGRLPWLLVTLPAGRHADVHGFRSVARAGLALKITGAAFLIAAMSTHSLWLAACGGFILVAGEVAFETAVHTSLLEVFAPAQRTRGNGQLYAWQATNGQFVGPSLGGILFVLNGYAVLLFAAILHLAASMTRREHEGPLRNSTRADDPTPPLRSMIQGFPVLFSRPGLTGTTIIGTISMLAYGLWSAVFVTYVTGSDALGLEPWTFGLLLACPALGSLPGAFASALFLRRFTAFGCILAMIAGQIGLFLPAATQAGCLWSRVGGMEQRGPCLPPSHSACRTLWSCHSGIPGDELGCRPTGSTLWCLARHSSGSSNDILHRANIGGVSTSCRSISIATPSI
jgi:MFS family permease